MTQQHIDYYSRIYSEDASIPTAESVKTVKLFYEFLSKLYFNNAQLYFCMLEQLLDTFFVYSHRIVHKKEFLISLLVLLIVDMNKKLVFSKVLDMVVSNIPNIDISVVKQFLFTTLSPVPCNTIASDFVSQQEMYLHYDFYLYFKSIEFQDGFAFYYARPKDIVFRLTDKSNMDDFLPSLHHVQSLFLTDAMKHLFGYKITLLVNSITSKKIQLPKAL